MCKDKNKARHMQIKINKNLHKKDKINLHMSWKYTIFVVRNNGQIKRSTTFLVVLPRKQIINELNGNAISMPQSHLGKRNDNIKNVDMNPHNIVHREKSSHKDIPLVLPLPLPQIQHSHKQHSCSSSSTQRNLPLSLITSYPYQFHLIG